MNQTAKNRNSRKAEVPSFAVSEVALDKDILLLLKNRDIKFLEKLFVEVNPYLLRVCLSHSIREEKADEVIHRTWETFFTKLNEFEGRSQIRTYICGILFNKIREFRREQGRTVFKEDSQELFEQAFDSEGWWKQAPHNPHRILELRQATELIEECLDGLSDQQKAAFVMKEVEEEDSEQICNVLGVNVTHLRVLLFRAKEKLRMCLEGKVSTEYE